MKTEAAFIRSLAYGGGGGTMTSVKELCPASRTDKV